MTEHKFTDEEVIRALGICAKAECFGDCEDMGCPAATKQGCRFYLRTDEDYEGVIQDEMLKDALDLINRQKEEIERLMAEAKIDERETKCTRIHRDTARAEAIKEFAERLKRELITGGIYPVLVKKSIDNLLKEMTEEKL